MKQIKVLGNPNFPAIVVLTYLSLSFWVVLFYLVFTKKTKEEGKPHGRRVPKRKRKLKKRYHV